MENVKSKKVAILSAVISIIILAIMMAVPVSAYYAYGAEKEFNIPSTTSPSFYVAQSTYAGNDIGAVYIGITAPSRVDYTLSLYVRNAFNKYEKKGVSFVAATTGLGGSCWWDSINSNGGSCTAKILIQRTVSTNNTTMSGSITTQTRTWHSN